MRERLRAPVAKATARSPARSPQAAQNTNAPPSSRSPLASGAAAAWRHAAASSAGQSPGGKDDALFQLQLLTKQAQAHDWKRETRRMASVHDVTIAKLREAAEAEVSSAHAMVAETSQAARDEVQKRERKHALEQMKLVAAQQQVAIDAKKQLAQERTAREEALGRAAAERAAREASERRATEAASELVATEQTLRLAAQQDTAAAVAAARLPLHVS